MKKFISLALCGLAFCSVSAQQANVDQAKKLAGKTDKISEARSLINQALQNPETANQAQTYYVAGKIEWDAFDKEQAASMITGKLDTLNMGKELVNGYNYYMQVFPLDNETNAKGEVKPKFTKELKGKISKKHDDFFNMGALLLERVSYYPTAFEAFMIYGDMPDEEVFKDVKFNIKDANRSRGAAYYYAGRAAFSSNNVEGAIEAFNKTIQQNYDGYDENNLPAQEYAIECWRAILAKDTTRAAEAHQNIYELALNGYNTYGNKRPNFLLYLVDEMNSQGKSQETLPILAEAIQNNPDKPEYYYARAVIYDNLNKDEECIEDYMKAVSLEDVNYNIIKAAIRKLFLVGQAKLNAIEINDPEYKSKRDNVKKNYLQEAQNLVRKAETLPDYPAGDLNYLEENINYLLGE